MKRYNTASLPYIAAAAQAVQFTHAGYVLFGLAGAVIGVIVGIVVSFSVATAASRVATIAKSRRGLGWAALVVLLLVSPAAIAPAAYYAIEVSMAEWTRILAAVTWALAPDLAIVLSGAIAGKALVTVEEAQAAAVAPAPKRTKQDKRRTCGDCGAILANANAYSAHMRWKHPKPLLADTLFIQKK